MASASMPAGDIADEERRMRLTLSVSLPRHPSSIGEARHVLAVLLSLTTADDETCDRLAILVTEACTNVVRHGDGDATIDLHVAIEDGSCLLEVGNRGRLPGGSFPFTVFPDASQASGRGLPLIAALSDSAEFVAAEPGYVLLRMTLRLRADHPRVHTSHPSDPSTGSE